MKINNSVGELTDISAEKKPLLKRIQSSTRDQSWHETAHIQVHMIGHAVLERHRRIFTTSA